MASEPTLDHTVILPGATIGILGGGQLGRMTAMAARSMGYDVHVLDPDPNCASRVVASRTITAPFSDAEAAAELARGCDVVTLEIEQIARPALDAVAAIVPLRPSADAVYVIQDRVRQKLWLSERGFPVGPFREADSAETIAEAVTAFGPSIAKACHGGYDGRGQVRLADAAGAADAWRDLGQRPCLVEQRVDIAVELSVLVARRASGETIAYPPSRNHHTNGILTWSVIPAELPDAVVRAAEQLAPAIAQALGVVGLLAVELFFTTDGRLLVNELAPRPHNTYHHSERACATGQFEQLVRAVCNLPLGAPHVIEPGAIVNLLGDVWLHDTAPDVPFALGVQGSRLHLYGKGEARPGRKMGHLSTVGETAQEAIGRALASYRRLSPESAVAAGLAGPPPALRSADGALLAELAAVDRGDAAPWQGPSDSDPDREDVG
jgi:5-(carboxyamino)imidazole ribonucleotide synthase